MQLLYFESFGAVILCRIAQLSGDLVHASQRCVDIAGRAMSLAMTAHWVCNFAVGQFFDYARVQWGAAGIFAFFGAMCAVAVVFIKSSVPETKGRSLEEVQAMLA